MFGKLIPLNLALALIAGILAYRVHQEWTRPVSHWGITKEVTEETEEQEAKGTKRRSDLPSLKAKNQTFPPLKDYEVIGQKNLFRPERNEWVPPPSVAEEKPLSSSLDSFTLYGVVTMPDGSKMALMEEISSPSISMRRSSSRSQARRSPSFPRPGAPSESRNVKKYRVNDRIGSYRVAEIQHDRVLLDGGGQKREILLRDPDNPKNRPAATAVARNLATPPPAVAGRTVNSPFPTSESAPPQPSPAEPSSAAATPGGFPQSKTPSPVTKNPSRAKGRQVIQTPFGPRVIYR